jgi:hypothetical protein
VIETFHYLENCSLCSCSAAGDWISWLCTRLSVSVCDMKFVKSLLPLFTFVLVIFCQSTHGLTEVPTESERQLKQMIQLVSSLMQRFGFSDGIPSTSGHVTANRERRQTYTRYPNSKNVRYLDNVFIELHDYGDEFNGRIHYREDSGGYGGYGGHGGYGGYGGYSGYNGQSKSDCSSDSYYLVPLLALTAMSVVLAYLLALATTTTTASTTTRMMMMPGRRRRENVHTSTEIGIFL